jgi:hypothetical protein
MPSPDGTYFYYTTGGSDPKAMRLRLADRKIEEIASLKDLKRVVDSVDTETQISVPPGQRARRGIGTIFSGFKSSQTVSHEEVNFGISAINSEPKSR